MARMINAIFAHPDDEVLGCGGTLARHADAGDDIRILILATGFASRATATDQVLQKLRDQARRASEILGAVDIAFCDLPDNAMDSLPLLDIVQRIEAFTSEHPPEVVYTHHAGDLNIDHEITHRAVMTALRPVPGIATTTILAAEVVSSTEWASPSQPVFVPTEFVDIAAYLDTKAKALSCYEGELRDWPHPRSLEGIRTLARWRGCQVGLDAAEAFAVTRRIVRD